MLTDLISETSIASVERTSVAYQSLVGLSKTGIRYCLWKSFDRFEEGIKGDTDFDILMDKKESQLVFNYLRQNGWFEVQAEPWRQFPDVHDFLQYDPKCKKFIHFHVHFKLVMGERLVKSLSLPLEALYLETSVEADGIFHAMPELEFCVFVLRLSLKIGWREYARIIRRRNRRLLYQSLLPEFEHIHKRCDRTKLETLLKHPSLCFIDLTLMMETFDDIFSLDYARRGRIQKLIAPYRRYGRVARIFVQISRSSQKRYFGLGKTLPQQGLSFAFCGADGSGKTTLVDGIEKSLSRQIKVVRFYMGGNNSSRDIPRWLFSTLLGKLFLGIRKSCRILKFNQGVSWIEHLYFGCINYLLAGEKYRRYRKSQKDLEKGALVLYERFPLFQGPGGDGGSPSGSAFCEKSEREYYGKINPPDIIFVLLVDSEIAIHRKPDHDPNVIRIKATAFEKFINEKHNNKNLVVIDANAPSETILATALGKINRMLASDN